MSSEVDKNNDEKQPFFPEMNFLDHLGELRKRIIVSLIAVILCSTIAGIFINFIMENILLKPAFNANLPLQNLVPFGQPFLYFKTILVCGIILAVPIILYQIWLFIAPGLYEKEKKWAGKITLYTSLCFFCGVAFSYFIMIPSMLSFANKFGTEIIKNSIDINAYFGFFVMILLASGVMFEMPMISYVLSKFGIINSSFLRKYRRHSIIVILIFAAVLTPTPDPITQAIFSAPLLILYEISILISKYANTNNNETIKSKSSQNEN